MNTVEEQLKSLLRDYIKQLEYVKDNVSIKFIKTLEFTTGEIYNFRNKSKIESIEKKDLIIYIIKTKEKFTEKEAVEGRNFLKNNEEPKYGAFRVNNKKEDNHFKYQQNETEKCLYIGSSQDIRARLKQHLGINGHKDFALHLSKWWEDKEIIIDLYEVTTNAEDMQLFEDRLWEYYKPLLGKQGKK